MRLEDFDYPLPKELIAQEPLARRDASRLLVVDRKSGDWADKTFLGLAELIPAGDALVLNNTKVNPCRAIARKKITGGKVDLLFLGRTKDPQLWRALIQPSIKEGQEMTLDGGPQSIIFIKRDGQGIPLLQIDPAQGLPDYLENQGLVPLPPYIKREPTESDRTGYQTVYAKEPGAVAAPTAGLHFTPEILKKLREKGVGVHEVTLHVGYGTFKPVEDLENHRLHAESFVLPGQTARALNEVKAAGKKIWAVGTTTLRVLETCVQNGKLIPGEGQTDLYIKPPFDFEIADHLLTNFHLPKTTLLLLVSAFMGEPLRKKTYDHAIAQRYRFYSYGDAMLII